MAPNLATPLQGLRRREESTCTGKRNAKKETIMRNRQSAVMSLSVSLSHCLGDDDDGSGDDGGDDDGDDDDDDGRRGGDDCGDDG